MRQLLPLLIAGVLAMTLAVVVMAGDKQETGVIKERVFRDSRYGYSVQIPTDWKEAKLRKEPSVERLIIFDKKAVVPLKLQQSPELATRPTMMIFADSSALTPDSLFATLLSDSGKSALKDRVQEKTLLLQAKSFNEIQIQRRERTKVAGKPALRLVVRREYQLQVTPPGRSSPMLVRDFVSGYIYILALDGSLMYVELVCENQLLESFEPVFEQMIQSLTFAGETAAPE